MKGLLRTLGVGAMVALPMVVLSACPGVKTSPPKPTTGEATSNAGPRLVELEDGAYVEIWPGVEPGFLHCCGDDDYIMEIDCSRGIKRCYKPSRRGDWRQTYGRECKSALDETCYLQSCDDICEAYWLYKDREVEDEDMSFPR